MKDNNEKLSAAKAEWLQTLDYDCRVNTINYWALRDQLRFGRLEGLAAKLYGFIKVRGWQKLGVFSSDGLKRTVASFPSFVDWCGGGGTDVWRTRRGGCRWRRCRGGRWRRCRGARWCHRWAVGGGLASREGGLTAGLHSPDLRVG